MKNLGDQLAPIVDAGKKIISHHAIIIILAGLCAVVFAVYTINQLLSMPDDDAYRLERQSDTIKTRFDQETIDKLERLRARQEQMTLDLPSGRVNPFVE